MDLSKFSTADLEALQAGDMARVSTEGLERLQSQQTMADMGAVQDPKSGAYAMKSIESPKMDILSALATGAGKKVQGIGAGLKQLFQLGAGQDTSELDQRQAFLDAAYEPVKKGRPVAAAIGETVPEIAATLALTRGTGFLPSVGGGFAGGAIPSALEYTPNTPTLEESLYARAGRGLSSGAAGAIGGGLGYGLTRMLQPISGSVKGVSDDALAAAKRVGYKPTPGEMTQSPMLQNLESHFARTPGTAGRFQAFREANQQALNRSATRAMGETGDEIGEGVFKAAKDRLGGEFTRINQGASPDASNLMPTLMRLDADNIARGSFRVPEVDTLVEKGLDLAAQGNLTGPAYQTIRSRLGAQAAGSTDATVKDALKSIQRSLDDAANASLPADEQVALAAVRKQYAAFKTLMEGKVVEGGNVSAARLASALPRKGNRTAFKTGEMNSDLMDIARIGESFKPPVNPNSGSLLATQSFAGRPLATAAMAATHYLPGRLYLSGPMQAYMTNRMLPPLLEQGLIRSGAPAGLIGLGLAGK